MKNAIVTGPTLSALVNDRLARLGAANVPPLAREFIEADVTKAVIALMERKITAPLIGRAVARSLAAPAAAQQEGSKGEQGSPLASSESVRKAQIRVAGPAQRATGQPDDPRQMRLPFPGGQS